MTSSGFDPRKFIGRERERERFEELLTFATPARILAVAAKGGDGKSFLLKKFQHRCRTGSPRIPFSLITLDQQDYTPLLFIKEIAAQLNSMGITFYNFERKEKLRLGGNFVGINSSTNLQGAEFSNARDTQIGAVIANINQPETVNVSTATTMPLTPEQDEAAQDEVIKSFFYDLHEYCTAKPIVVILDSYEKCDAKLEHWLVNHFLERNFFSSSCESCLLGLVIAGKKVPDFYELWPKEECDSKIILVKELSKWTKDNVAECLLAHGNNNYESHIDAIYELIERGKSLLEVVQVIGIFSNKP